MENKTFTALALGSPSTDTASVYVYTAGTSTLANIYGSNVVGSPLAQPLTTNNIGQVSFWAPNGNYDLKFITPGGQQTPLKNVEFFDGSAAVISLSNEGSGAGVIDLGASVSGALVLKSITGSSGITITANPTSINISAPSAVSGVASEGTGNPIYDAINSTGSNVKIKSLAAGSNVTISDSGTTLTVSAVGAAAAWVAFDSSGTIIGQFNVSSVTHTGTGAYTVNFTSPIANANYAAVVGAIITGGGYKVSPAANYSTRTTSALQVNNEDPSNTNPLDSGMVVVVFD